MVSSRLLISASGKEDGKPLIVIDAVIVSRKNLARYRTISLDSSAVRGRHVQSSFWQRRAAAKTAQCPRRNDPMIGHNIPKLRYKF